MVKAAEVRPHFSEFWSIFINYGAEFGLTFTIETKVRVRARVVLYFNFLYLSDTSWSSYDVAINFDLKIIL